MSVGAGAGVTHSYADVFGNSISSAAKLEFSYYLNQFINVGLNYQRGKIVGGNVYTNKWEREFTNNFNSVDMHVKLQLGAFVDYEESIFLNGIKGLYVGTGIGGIQNNHKNSIRYRLSTGEKFPGYDRSKEMFIPLMAGINFHIPDKLDVTRVMINLNFQGNIVSGEGLDSYDFNGTLGKQNIPDIFTFMSIGVSYHFGRTGWFSHY
ncbi:MAG: hypothetical protein EOO88_56585 [Pedobacter sp.]|nr:MAG: hypothetical protein EOO88_56585 [Pedobacter sp.]